MQLEDDEGGLPNFFCRLPTTSDKVNKVDRAASPPPLAFLQHIYDNYRQIELEVRGEATSAHAVDAKQTKNKRGDTTWTKGHSSSDASHSSSAKMNTSSSSSSSTSDISGLSSPTIDDNTLEEAPWFSQLANLPQLRSAGIPMVALGTTSRNTLGIPRKPMSLETATLSSSSCRSADSSNTVFSPASYSSTESSSGSMNGANFNSLDTVMNPPTASKAMTTSSEGKMLPPPPLKPSATTTSASSAPLVPPENFAMVNSWVYRSSFPKKRHFPFLKTLKLKSVLTLILEEYPEQNTQFLDDNGITFFQFGIPGNKEPFVHIPPNKITAALVTILDRRNHPILIHCNKGKHRTGCLIGCLRKLQQWSLTTIFDEYRRFSFPKSRSMDQEFIELYNENLVWLQVERFWLPRWAVLAKGGQQHRRLEEEQEEKDHVGQIQRNHKVAAHSTLFLTVDAVHRLKMKGM